MNVRNHPEQWTITDATANADKALDKVQPVWQVIRSRLLAANRRFHANDNIAEFVLPGELDLLQEEVRENLEAVLNSLVIDTDNDHNTRETARRVAKMYLTEVFQGRYSAAPAITQFPNAEQLSELLIVGPVAIRSACSHHLCPIVGRVWIGVMPNENSHLIGLSKYARLTEWILSRPQIQEEAVSQLANALEEYVRPDGIAVVLEAEHFCMSWRGVKDNDAKMLNSVMRGSFLTNPELRAEFISLLPRT